VRSFTSRAECESRSIALNQAKFWYYFFDENGSTMSISGDDLPAEGIQSFLAENQDELKKKYHMILLKNPSD
jgi:hypothetical protein